MNYPYYFFWSEEIHQVGQGRRGFDKQTRFQSIVFNVHFSVKELYTLCGEGACEFYAWVSGNQVVSEFMEAGFTMWPETKNVVYKA